MRLTAYGGALVAAHRKASMERFLAGSIDVISKFWPTQAMKVQRKIILKLLAEEQATPRDAPPRKTSRLSRRPEGNTQATNGAGNYRLRLADFGGARIRLAHAAVRSESV